MGKKYVMGEHAKNILAFLQEHKEVRFTFRNIMQEYNKTHTDQISYVTICKWTEVLYALGKVNMEDYGVLKVVWCE